MITRLPTLTSRRWRALRLAVAILGPWLVSAAPSRAQLDCPWANCATGTTVAHTITITTNLETRETNNYYVYRPRGLAADPSHPTPLMLVLHGGTQMPLDVETESRMSTVADHYKAVVVYPEGPGRRWSKPLTEVGADSRKSDVPYLMQLLDTVIAGEAIDPSQVYVSGHSAGAQMTIELYCDPASAGRFAGFGIVSGNLQVPLGGGTPNCPAAPTGASVIAFIGLADQYIPYAGLSLRNKQLLSQPAMRDWFATRLGCVLPPVQGMFGTGDRIQRDRAVPCAAPGQQVQLITVPGGQHGWYGLNDREGLQTSQVLWAALAPTTSGAATLPAASAPAATPPPVAPAPAVSATPPGPSTAQPDPGALVAPVTGAPIVIATATAVVPPSAP